MALSYVQTLGDGTTKQFSFEFEYLSKSHVTMSVDGVDVPFTWLSTYTVVADTAPPDQSVVEVRRTTPRDAILVEFVDGSTLLADDLNVSTLQAFFLSQEAFDQGSASLAVTTDGQYSAQTRRISNVGDPINDQDVVTKAWAMNTTNTNVGGAVAAKNGAVTAQEAAEQAASDAHGYKNAASTSSGLAAAAKTGAEAAQLAAEDARDTTNTLKSDVQTLKTDTQAVRDEAVAARDTTLGYRDTAGTYKDTAVAKAAEAAASAAALVITVSTDDPADGTDGNLWFKV